MNRFVIVALLALVGCFLANAADKSKCTSNFCTDVKGKSGKISIWRGAKGTSFAALTFEMKSIKELDAGGNEVKDPKHSYTTFANLDFTISAITEKTFKDVKADSFTFQATIPGPNATLLFEMLFIKEDKINKLCDESEYQMTNGSVKFNIEIQGWNFCNESAGVVCKNDKMNQTGAFIELAALVKAPKDKEAKEDKEGKDKGGEKEKGKRLILDDILMKLPEAVVADGNCNKMVDGFPKFTKEGKKQTTTFRFKKFNSKVVYDPIIEEYNAHPNTTKTPPPTTATTQPPTTSGSTVSLSMLVACIAALVKLFA